jgi:hypothetical protein
MDGEITASIVSPSIHTQEPSPERLIILESLSGIPLSPWSGLTGYWTFCSS